MSSAAPTTPRELHPAVFYARELTRHLPPAMFRPVPARLLWIPFHLSIVATAIVVEHRDAALAVRVLASVAIGHSLACMAFLGHEILHGSVVRKHFWRRLFGGICMASFGLAPAVWVWWHNRNHHRATQDPLRDPDCTGTMAVYRHSPLLRRLERFLPGSRTLRSYVFPFFHFSVVSTRAVMTYPGHGTHKIAARLYHTTILVTWATAAHLLAPRGLLFLMLIPMAVSNALLMSYIDTNHLLCPLTRTVNDPLANSLTVRSYRWLERLHLQFGFHVEHHVFPTMSGLHLPHLAATIKNTWPDRYNEMGHAEAIVLLYRTPRIYKSDSVLVDPRTGRVGATLPELRAP